MRLSVIIPAWNLWELTRDCLLSLRAHSRDANLQVIVVDNGSTDATREALEPLGRECWGGDFLPLRLPENEGFARACNAGARAADGDALFFLNNDITFSPDWLPPLTAALARPGTVAVGPLLLYPDGTCQHCGVSLSPMNTLCHLYEGFPGDHPALRRPHPLRVITGAALLLPRAGFAAAGGFHEGYRNGFEDLDLCLTLGAQGGRLRLAGDSVLCHRTSQTPGRFDRDAENAALFASRWGGKWLPDLHVQAAVDGYETRLTPGGTPYVALPEARARELDAATGDEAFLRDQLRREPLWINGYVRLAGALEREGRHGEALGILEQGMRLLPVPEICLPLLRLARLCRQPDVMAETLPLLEVSPARREQTRAQVRACLQAARQHGDAMLQRLLRKWLAENSPPPQAGA